jgi:hypothetical protein
MRFRQREVEYAIKYDNNAKAARRVITALFRENFSEVVSHMFDFSIIVS